MKTAVIVGRFQAPLYHNGYKALIDYARSPEYKKIIIVMCNAYRIPSKTDPLSFKIRQKLMSNYLNQFSNIEFEILPLPDMESDERWSKSLDTLLEVYGVNLNKCDLLHSRDSFKDYYSGKITSFVEVEQVELFSSTEVRSQSIQRSNNNLGNIMSLYATAWGITATTQQGYPAVVPTVDIMVIVKKEGMNHLLLGRKEYKDTYCLPGGFVDSKDKSLKEAAQRELLEETQIQIPLSELQYVDSFKIKDWRFKGEDSIMTSLFIAVIDGDTAKGKLRLEHLKASDDLAELFVCDIDEVTLNMISENHKELILKGIEYATSNGIIPERVQKKRRKTVG